MQSFHLTPKSSQRHQGRLYCTLALAMATCLSGFTFFEDVPSARAEQANPQASSSTTARSQDQGDMQKRLEGVEKELEQIKVEREKVRRDRAKRLAEEKKQDREWETKFDLLRRDPISRLELAKDGWMSFENFESQVRFGGFFQTNLIHNFQGYR